MTADQDQKSRSGGAKPRSRAMILLLTFIVLAALASATYFVLPHLAARKATQEAANKELLAQLVAEDEASAILDGFYIVDREPFSRELDRQHRVGR